MGSLLCTPQSYTESPPATTAILMQGVAVPPNRVQNNPPDAQHNPRPNNPPNAQHNQGRNNPPNAQHNQGRNNPPNAQHNQGRNNPPNAQHNQGRNNNPNARHNQGRNNNPNLNNFPDPHIDHARNKQADKQPLFRAHRSPITETTFPGERYLSYFETFQIDSLTRQLNTKSIELERSKVTGSTSQLNELQNSINELKIQIKNLQKLMRPTASGSTSTGSKIKKSVSWADISSSSNFAESSSQAQARRSRTSSNPDITSTQCFLSGYQTSSNLNSTSGPRRHSSSTLMGSRDWTTTSTNSAMLRSSSRSTLDAPTTSTNPAMSRSSSRSTLGAPTTSTNSAMLRSSSRSTLDAPTTSRTASTSSRASTSRYTGSNYYKGI